MILGCVLEGEEGAKEFMAIFMEDLRTSLDGFSGLDLSVSVNGTTFGLPEMTLRDLKGSEKTTSFF